MAVPRVYVRRETIVWSVTLTFHISRTDALTLIFLYLYTIGPKGAIISSFLMAQTYPPPAQSKEFPDKKMVC